jgi:hypothetical protein
MADTRWLTGHGPFNGVRRPTAGDVPREPRGYITPEPAPLARDEHQAGVLLRLRQSVRLVDDLDLIALSEEYGGPDSVEHDGVQTLIALARELRLIERALR